MPDSETDVTPDSSTATSEVVTQETGTAASDTQTDAKAPEAAATDKATPETSVEPPEKPTSEKAIEFLTGKKRDKSKAVEKPVDDPKKAEKPTEEKKPEEESVDEGVLSDEDKKLLGEKTQKRIRTLAGRATQAEAKLKEAEPLINRGKVFGDIVDKYKLHNDLAFLPDEQLAGTMQFQAAVARALQKQATQTDIQTIQSSFEALDKLRGHFGIPHPQGEVKTSVDPTELEGALNAIRKDFDFGPMEKMLEKVKANKPQEQAKAPAVSLQQPTQLQQPQKPNYDVQLYGNRLTRELKDSGVTDAPKYMAEKLWPLILSEMRADFPLEDPVAVYSNLSASAQYEAAQRAHAEVQKKAASLKPATQPRQTQVKPVTTTRTGMQKEEGATGSVAAIRFLTGSN